MVAVINFASSLRNVMNYNENKLAKQLEITDKKGQKQKIQKAEFIHSMNYGKDTDQLRFNDRFRRLEKQMKLHENRKKSVTHISLNFDPSEKDRLNNDLLRTIADTYMQKIGFGDQPYLVYKHNDAGHPHIHIVSTIIQNNGVPIETQWIGKNVSEPARKEIEQQFGLVVADQRRKKEQFELRPVNTQKAQYGKSETKRAITNVLDAVLQYYKYASLTELNAVLKHYNVVADQGGENSRIMKNNGLVYRILDEKGDKVGVPIKASDIYLKPGMKYLQDRFVKNEPLKGAYKLRIKNAIDLALAKRTIGSMEQLQDALKRDNIHLVLRQNKQDIIYGLTIVDHYKKVVFNGSDLGKNYSAAGIQQRLGEQTQTIQPTVLQRSAPMDGQRAPTSQHKKQFPKQKTQQQQQPFKTEDQQAKQAELPVLSGGSSLKELLNPEPGPEQSSFELPGTKKKRKKKKLHL